MSYKNPLRKTVSKTPSGLTAKMTSDRKIEPSPYQRAIYDFVRSDKRNLAINAVAGCLAEDTVVEVNRAGKSYRTTIAQLVHMMNGGSAGNRKFDLSIPTQVRAYDSKENIIRLMTVDSGVCSGIKTVYQLRTKTKTIKATANHKFLTVDGWKKLSKLTTSDRLLVDGGKGNPSGQQPKKHYERIVGMDAHPYCHSSHPHMACWKHRLVVEAALNDLSYDALVRRIRIGNIKGLKFLDPQKWHVHHRDSNHKNNRLDNLEAMAKAAHLSHHAKETHWKNSQAWVTTERIVSIKEIGEQPTYDLTMSDTKNPNFLANGIVVHNSGKTTTLVECARILNQMGETCCAIAFNTDIAKELQARVGSAAKASTLHSLGFGICRQLFGAIDFNPRTDSPHFLRLKSAVETGRVPLLEDWTPYRAALALKDMLGQLQHGLDVSSPHTTSSGKIIPEHFIDFIEEYLDDFNTTIARLHDTGGELAIDFNDMVYVPAKLLTPNRSPYAGNVLLVDETQDLDPYQYQLITRLAPSRIVFVGDPNQSCYAWRGAMMAAWDHCVEHFQCEELPLSTSWRCAKSIVRHANKYVDRIAPADTAQDGVVQERTLDEMVESAQPGDFILCRNNAPIIKLCIADMLEGRPSRVVGRDIKQMLLGVVKEIAGKDLEATLKNLSIKRATLVAKNPQSYVLDLFDATNHLLTALDEDPKENPQGGKAVIQSFSLKLDYLFREPLEECITYRTIHKAKGNEAETVWWYLPQLLPSRFAKTDEEIQQEDNLAYVATTRAKKNLYLVYG